MKIKRKNPYLGGLLGLFGVIFSTLYYGGLTFLLTISAAIIVLTVTLIFRLYIPQSFFGYLFPIYFMVYNFFITKTYNTISETIAAQTANMTVNQYEGQVREFKLAFAIRYASDFLKVIICVFVLVSEVISVVDAFKIGQIWIGIFFIITIPISLAFVVFTVNFIVTFLLGALTGHKNKRPVSY